MVPFRVYDRQKEQFYVVLCGIGEKGFLAAIESEEEDDGALSMLTLDQVTKMNLVDFLSSEDDEIEE